MAKIKNKGKPKKQGNQSIPQLPSIQSTRKCFDEALEILRNAEEGSVLYDIYIKGGEDDSGFTAHYDFLTNAFGNIPSFDQFTIYLGHNEKINRYVLGFFFPDELSFPLKNFVGILDKHFPNNTPIIILPDKGYLLLPLTPAVIRSFGSCLVDVHNCISSFAEKCNRAATH